MTTLKFLAGIAASVALWTASTGTALAAREDCDAAVAAVKSQLEAACPCDKATAPNEHVRCVTKKVRELSECKRTEGGERDCGPLPRRCMSQIRRAAAHSTCGKPDLVTCCVPRQHDCVRDPKPGDGKAEGTCHRSKKKCDQLSDCLIPKCQPAASAERCMGAGGTIGRGKDCATACTE